MSDANANLLVTVRSLRKAFPTAAGELVVLNALDLTVEEGEMLAVVGASGSGKSTLLHILGSLDTATSGEIEIAGTQVHRLNIDSAADFRARTVGFLWQLHWLLPDFSAVENVAMPLQLRGESEASALNAAGKWLDRVGLSARAHHRSGELSGGEQQRVALSRALVTGPKLLLADEPTGDLDSATSATMMDLLLELQREQRLTSIIVTHDMSIAARCSRTLRLSNGTLVTPAQP